MGTNQYGDIFRSQKEACIEMPTDKYKPTQFNSNKYKQTYLKRKTLSKNNDNEGNNNKILKVLIITMARRSCAEWRHDYYITQQFGNRQKWIKQRKEAKEAEYSETNSVLEPCQSQGHKNRPLKVMAKIVAKGKTEEEIKQ